MGRQGMKKGASVHSHAPFGGRLVKGTPDFLRTQLWVWPLFAAALLVFVGIWMRGRIARAMEANIGAHLQTTLNANAEALREWAAAMRSLAEVVAADEGVKDLSRKLLVRAQAKPAAPSALSAAPELQSLNAHLAPLLRSRGFEGYALLDTNLVVLAASAAEAVGRQCPSVYAVV